MTYPPRVRFGVAAAVALSMWGVIEYFGFEAAWQKQSRDPYQIAAQSSRLAGAAAAVPDSAVLGYTTDLEPGSVAALAMFNAAQYALTPRLILQNAAQPRVLGNFARPADYAAIGRRYGLLLERDFQNGVVLFRKDPAK